MEAAKAKVKYVQLRDISVGGDKGREGEGV